MSNFYASGGNPAPSAYLMWTDASNNGNTLTFDVVITENWEEAATVTEHPVEIGTNVADHVRVSLIKCELKIYSSNEPLTQANSALTPIFNSSNIAPTRGALPLNVPTVSWTAQPLTLTYPIWVNNIVARSLLQTATGGIGSAVGGTTGGVIGAAAGGLLGSLLLSGHSSTANQGTDAGLEPTVLSSPTADVDQWSGETDFVQAMHQLLQTLKNNAQQLTVMGTKNSLTPMVIDNLTFARSVESGSGEYVTIGMTQVRVVTTSLVPVPIPNLSAGGGTATASHGGQDPAPAPPVQAESALHALVASIFGASSNQASAATSGGP